MQDDFAFRYYASAGRPGDNISPEAWALRTERKSGGETAYFITKDDFEDYDDYTNQRERVEVEISEDEYREIVKGLEDLKLSALPEGKGEGFDGRNYEVKIAKNGAIVSFSWWMDPPTEWQPLLDVVNKIAKVFQSKF